MISKMPIQKTKRATYMYIGKIDRKNLESRIMKILKKKAKKKVKAKIKETIKSGINSMRDKESSSDGDEEAEE